MAKADTADLILDCYTDEPSGLGVPPYLGVYPRYLLGYLEKAYYLTIDDLRYFFGFVLDNKRYDINRQQKTNIRIYNLTNNINDIRTILQNTQNLYIILGVHTPGKYLSAVPGTLHELSGMIKEIKRINNRINVILTGPAIYGTQLYGGKFSEKIDPDLFGQTDELNFSYKDIARYAPVGASIIEQIPGLRIVEIETGRGCNYGRCSFCTEPIKHKLEFREQQPIIDEIRAFYEKGVYYFRLGKQSDIYSYPNISSLLKKIRQEFPKIKVLHIDNVNPRSVIKGNGEKITQAIAEYCTAGNVAAFGIESFDEKVSQENCLNSSPEESFEAVSLLNRYGRETGENGMPRFLPGINLLFGLKGESKDTHKRNMFWLKRILDENLLVRRINIRQLSIFEGTPIYRECKDKFLRKNSRYYWKWRNDIRQNIDFPMLQRLVPKGAVISHARAEIYDGNTTFLRQIGTYPLIVGVKKRLELGNFYTLRIKDHMLRSVVGEVILP